jgi:cytochrome c-type biogenesis protein CcmH
LLALSDLGSSPAGFLAGLVLLSLLAMAVVAWALLRRPAAKGIDQQLRLAVYRDRRKEIEQELALGRLTPQEAERTIEALAQEWSENNHTLAEQFSRVPKWATAVMVLLVPIVGLLVYGAVGAPAIVGIDQQAMQGQVDPARLKLALTQLQERVEANPQDFEGWVLLGQARRLQEDLPGAVQAYGKAVALPQANARLMAEYAEAMVLARQGDFSGEPLAVLEKAHAKEPNEPKTLGLLGAAQFRTGRPEQAVVTLQKLLAQLPPNSEQSKQIQSVIEGIQAQLGQGSAPVAGSPQPAAPATDFRVPVVVRIDPSIQPRAGTVMFVSARAAQGPRQPIAAQRITLDESTLARLLKDGIALELSNANLMNPERRLESADSLVLEARISESGQALRQPGDLIGSTSSTNPQAGTLVIISGKVQ